MNPIEIRKSTRTFQNMPLTTSDLNKIATFLRDPKNSIGPHGNQFHFELVLETGTQEKEQLGTYGVIQNAQGYILGSSTKETEKLFDYAFALENIVLYLTSLGIATCWLGGRFDKQQAMSRISLADNKIIPAITPIGYPKEKPHLKARVMKTVLRPHKRKLENELFFYETFDTPLGNRAGDFKQALHYLRIAPSAMNKQPWRIIFNSDLSQVHFYLISALADHPLYMCEPEYLDIGIAYHHFKAGLDEVGITGKLVKAEPAIEKPEGAVYITSWHRNH